MNKNWLVLEIIEEVQSFLESHQNHHRLQVFHLKGLVCVYCGIEGNKIVISDHGKGGIHKDLYHWTEEKKVLMTVDHIIPRSKGGKDFITNKQPMCTNCNSKKSDKIIINENNLPEKRLLDSSAEMAIAQLV